MPDLSFTSKVVDLLEETRSFCNDYSIAKEKEEEIQKIIDKTYIKTP